MWTDSDTFEFFVPAKSITIQKSGDPSTPTRRWIQGIASTPHLDLQNESVDQGGIDFSYFLEHGFFNDDHKSGPEYKVGQPTEAKVTPHGLWVKGFLFEGNPRADAYWELLNSLKTSGSSRKVGFSIQGKVKRREGNKITECWIQDIAITASPVNTATWAEVVKSLTAANSPLSPESLDEDLKKEVEGDEVEKGLSFEEAVSYYISDFGLPREVAESVASYVYSNDGE